ncbi:alpha/beta hydrolase fold-containing protein [Phanerochaete sordida]|uniref:Alpha/beta hydrolase fold-containing protein n=1 Tax=Phanerochaete sordida TaxID=48140 RepID=A0A9P3FZ28_9APHY|nr:alpha/beta hydrolase fold-containing protein [Phanerochaete sordida]
MSDSEPASAASRAADPIPLVIVEGFLGGAGPFLWGNFHSYCDPDGQLEAGEPRRKVIFASIGPVSSLHDRACELYYTLKGGTVDYGAEHSQASRHARYGRYHSSGLYPEWSPEKPVHFIGHSMGGPTVTKLQWLLGSGFFGKSETPDMVLSLVTVSSPFRGTQAVYTLGERTEGAPRVRPFSVGSFLTKGVHIASYLSPHMPSFLDMHADARSLSYMTTTFREFTRLLRQSNWGESRDAAPFDVTFEAADLREANGEGLPYPRTFYRSYAASMTSVDAATTKSDKPSMRYALLNPPLFVLSSAISSYDFSYIKPSPSVINVHHPRRSRRSSRSGPNRDALRANDGIVPVLSQWHPLNCSETTCRHWPREPAVPQDFSDLPDPVPGLWDVFEVPDATHISLVPFWYGTARQRAFWGSVGRWLREIDHQVAAEGFGEASLA